MNLTRKSWPKGWNPSQDSINGDPEALLRMDNLTLDEDGSLTLVRGEEVIGSAYSSGIIDLYSRTIHAIKHRYVALAGGSVIKNGTEVLSGGSTEKTAFGQALGQVLICSGDKRKKDDGTDVRDLGIKKPDGPPALAASSQDPKYLISNWDDFYITDPYEGDTLVKGLDYVQWNTTTPPAAGSLPTDGYLNCGGVVYSYFSPVDTAEIAGGRSDNSDDDIVSFNIRIGNTTYLHSVRLEFLLDPDTANKGNFYHYTWINDQNSPFKAGINAWSALKARRGDFLRDGPDNNLWWDAVYGVRIVIIGNTEESNRGKMEENVVNNIAFTGGPHGKLNGLYEYTQVNVYDSGQYQAKSPHGPVASEIYTSNGYISVTPDDGTDSQANQVWIYRRSKNPGPDWPLGLLDKFYRVLVIEGSNGNFATTDDKMSDEDALQLNIPLNENLLGVDEIEKDIIGIEALYFDRVLYLTDEELHLSEPLNPDAIDLRFSIRVSGDPTEKNLWICKIENGVLLLATTKEIYTISGSLTELPDGTIDATIKPIGEPHPPLCRNFTKDGGYIIYVGDDGWRLTAGGNSELLSYTLRKLFEGEYRHGFPFVQVVPNNGVSYPCAVAHGELFTSNPMADGTRWTLCYDLVRKYWHPIQSAPTAFFTEDDGTLLAGFTNPNELKIFDKGASCDSNTTPRNVELRTIYDDDQKPRNRKDVFTFKTTLDSGDMSTEILIGKNGGNYTSVGSVAFDGPVEKLITIAESIGLGKTYSVKIKADAVLIFRFINFTLEYEPRPEQLTYIRIPYSNLGSQSRKRFVNYAFVIDTLGVDCEFFPLIDGVAGTSSIVNLDRKGTYIHYFKPTDSTADQFVGTDIGGIICGFFEFYGVNAEEIISEKLPVPTKFLIIPANDYGTPNRKRHSSYKFQIHTRGADVRFTPKLDGTFLAPLTINTSEKKTVEYFFTSDTTAIDVGGTLESLADTPFEFYGVIVPQNVEVLPPRLKEFRIPENNYGVASKKRVRVMPMEINTNGSPVVFTPVVDGMSLAPSTITTSRRQTAFHYFSTDIFGVDYSGDLIVTPSSGNPFEFYGLLKPEEVEILPVGRKFDQIGPIRLDKIGKLLAIRLRAIFGDATVAIKIKTERDVTIPDATLAASEYTTTLIATPNVDDVYEILLPKTVKGTIFRMEIGPTVNPFYRYALTYKANLSGMETDSKWIEVK